MMAPKFLKSLLRPSRDWIARLWHRYISPGFAWRLRKYDAEAGPSVSIVLVTYNRIRMLRECMSSLLRQTPIDGVEIIVWENASTDGTAEYLDELAATHSYVRVIHSPKNVGLNGVARSVKLARGFHIVEMDDDVLRFPDGWLPQMLHAFTKIPRAGFLAANVVQDEITNGNKPGIENYTAVDYDGVIVEQKATTLGWTGGWCTMTSLEVLSKVGNFPQRRGRVFFSEDGDYARRCIGAGLTVGILRDVVVYHAYGPKANDLYGCLDVCDAKYSDGPEYSYQHSGVEDYAQGRDPTGQRFKRV